jgi:AcrR family transcriptional regulator
MSGRQAEAARNDQRILESARAVFVADPGAPITAVAKHAGVGISALYTRYGSKEELLRTLCTDGLQTFVQETEAAIERVKQGHDHWQVFAAFMQNLVDADTSSLTRAFAYKFAPTPEMCRPTTGQQSCRREFFGLIRDVLRPDLCCTTSAVVRAGAAIVRRPRAHRARALVPAPDPDGMRGLPRPAPPGAAYFGWRSANAERQLSSYG